MTVQEAQSIIQEYYDKSILTDDEEFIMIEALEFLIVETKNTRWMVMLGGHYYGNKQYDLALKYYEMADTYGDLWAAEGLGYIWYYGRTGERDYEKAFNYYSKAAANGIQEAKYKLADMYKNGYFVEKNYDKYCEIIEELYESIESGGDQSSRADIFTRLARIRKSQGRIDEAVELYLRAKEDVAYRLRYNPFFGSLNVMKWLTEDLYTMIEVDPADFDLYDLYYILGEPKKVAFTYAGEEYMLESLEEEGGIVIKFQGTWYRSIDDFFLKAAIDEKRLPTLYYSLYAFRMID